MRAVYTVLLCAAVILIAAIWFNARYQAGQLEQTARAVREKKCALPHVQAEPKRTIETATGLSVSSPADAVEAEVIEHQPDSLQSALEYFADTNVPLKMRLAQVEMMGTNANPESVAILMVLGDEPIFVNYAAVEALGHVRSREVIEYVSGKLSAKDPKVVSAAVGSITMLLEDSAVPVLEETLDRNRHRDDGYQGMVCGACVKALGQTRSPLALPILKKELVAVLAHGSNYEYGSEIVSAFGKVGMPGDSAALLAYSDALQEELAKYSDNPEGHAYISGKIKEAQDAATLLQDSSAQAIRQGDR